MSFNYTTDVEFDYLFKILIIGESGVGYVLNISFSLIKISINIEKLHYYNDLLTIIFLLIL
jgi:hypothetical protein